MNRNKRSSAGRGRGANKKHRARWQTYLLMAICLLTLVSGFFFAGRQHFSSMDYGMKNSRLRRQIDELQAEKRRLMLAREVSLSPAEIKKAVKRAGLIAPVTPNSEIAQVASVTRDKAVPANPAQAKPMIIKTSAVSPVRSGFPDPDMRTAKLVRPIRSTPAAE